MKQRKFVLLLLVGAALTVLGSVASRSGDQASAAPTVISAAVAQPAAEFRQIPWDALVPKGWDPMKEFKGMDTGGVQDNSDKAIALMEAMQAAYDNAPTVSTMNGARVKIGGYIVPLEGNSAELREFLLVPYFGACIHTPPPPANQIVRVVPASPLKGFSMMQPVWVSGALKVNRRASGMGTSGYELALSAIEPYVRDKNR